MNKLNKSMLEGEIILREKEGKKGEQQGYIASLCFEDELMLGYFWDWWDDVGKEQFEASLIDL